MSAVCATSAVGVQFGKVSVGRRSRTCSRPARAALRVRATGTEIPGMGPELKGAIDSFINDNKVVLFMKGTKDAPRCGFSNTCVQIFKSMEVPFETAGPRVMHEHRTRG